MKLMLITNKVDIARYAVDCQIERLFVDLEILGKFERQGHLDTVISQHSMEDVGVISRGVPGAELLVRINPLHDQTSKEVDEAIAQGADIIMLPMFETNADIEAVGKMIDGRVRFIPLIETKSAAENLADYINSPYFDECYIGLNDLHRQLGMKFMFEPLSSGYIEYLTSMIKAAGKTFGFGGIARIGDGVLPARLVLAEHVRLGSSAVILSRAFHQRSQTLAELQSKIDLRGEIEKLYRELDSLKIRSEQDIENDRQSLVSIVEEIVKGML